MRESETSALRHQQDGLWVGLHKMGASEKRMTRKSMPREECVALAHRVSGGDRGFVNWVHNDPSDKIIGRHFDSPRVLAKCLLREMEAAGHVVLTSSDGYRLANPKNGRFQSLKKKLESDWLPQAQELSLVEYLENLFVGERGAIRREHIEQMNLALAMAERDQTLRRARDPDCGHSDQRDGSSDRCLEDPSQPEAQSASDPTHRANGSDGTRMKNLTSSRRMSRKTAYKFVASTIGRR